MTGVIEMEPRAIAKLDYFSGGVPPLSFFKLRLDEIVQLADQRPIGNGLDFVAELCIIGLSAYFEAFCKDQFAAIINIAPCTLEHFTKKRECTVPVKSLLPRVHNLSQSLGFILAEGYDFGTAKHVNSLFSDLLKITPFSKTEIVKYSEFLRDRNLLVHHGGVFTTQYAFQKFDTAEMNTNVNWNSLVVGKKDVRRWAKFLFSVAEKFSGASAKALLQLGNDLALDFSAETVAAIEALRWQ